MTAGRNAGRRIRLNYGSACEVFSALFRPPAPPEKQNRAKWLSGWDAARPSNNQNNWLSRQRMNPRLAHRPAPRLTGSAQPGLPLTITLDRLLSYVGHRQGERLRLLDRTRRCGNRLPLKRSTTRDFRGRAAPPGKQITAHKTRTWVRDRDHGLTDTSGSDLAGLGSKASCPCLQASP